MSEKTPKVYDDPFADAKEERRTIKEGMITQSYGDYYKSIVSDLNAILGSAIYYVDAHATTSESYDGNDLKGLQESINNIQDYKEKLNNQYTTSLK